MKIDKIKLNVNLTILMLFFITYIYKFPVKDGMNYGLPFKYLMIYSNGKSFFSSFKINFLYLLGDFIVLFIFVCIFRFIFNIYISKRRK